MRVARYYSNHDIRVEEAPVPEIGPGELLVKVWASGICGSDVMEWYRIQKAPLVLGHEIAGEIVKAGEGVENFRVGDRVFVSHHVPCNTCRYCQAGFHTACDTLGRTNFDPGGFAEFLRVPVINVDRGVFVLPDEMTYEDATFIEPLACVWRGQRLARMGAGKSVLVMGSGISGLLHIALARALGAARIMATDINDFRLESALKFGADDVFLAGEDVPEKIRASNNGLGADMIITCTGALSALEQSIDCAERGGTIMLFAPTNPGESLSVPVNDLWKKGVTLTPSYGASSEDIIVSIDLIRFGRVAVTDMITHRLSLDEAPLGFDLVARAEDSIKVVIEPQV